MKVRARHWVSYQRNFYRVGQVFDIIDADWRYMKHYCELVSQSGLDSESEQAPKQTSRGRKKTS